MSERPYKLMIDPGHGGRDPGAVNTELMIMEKDINLKVAKFMDKICSKGDYLFEPFTTRDTDIYVPLSQRADAANSLEVDAFLSIHVNSRPRPGKPGLELESYYYPGALAGRAFAGQLVAFLAESLSSRIKCFDRGEKEARFYVLRKTKMPAALVELGFICDPEEALFLNKRKNQKIIAYTLTEACEYFLEGGAIL